MKSKLVSIFFALFLAMMSFIGFFLSKQDVYYNRWKDDPNIKRSDFISSVIRKRGPLRYVINCFKGKDNFLDLVAKFYISNKEVVEVPVMKEICETLDFGSPIKDPWGQDIWYEIHSEIIFIHSSGPDKKRKTNDDLNFSIDDINQEPKLFHIEYP